MSGGMLRVLLALPVALAALAAAATPSRAAEAGSWNIERLMGAMREVRASTAHFVERRYVQMLTEPIETTGTLIYVAPDKLQRDDLAPKPSRMVVEDGKLTVDRGPGGGVRSFVLADNPEIGVFVESIRATLAGDLPALTRFYTVNFSGGAADWTLDLVPKDEKVRKLVSRIRIGGGGSAMRRVETQEADGDRTEMLVTEEQR
jgi:hypothetical protein